MPRAGGAGQTAGCPEAIEADSTRQHLVFKTLHQNGAGF